MAVQVDAAISGLVTANNPPINVTFPSTQEIAISGPDDTITPVDDNGDYIPLATEAKQDDQISLLNQIDINLDSVDTTLDSILDEVTNLDSCSNSSVSSVNVTTTTTQLLPINTNRKGASFYNDGGGNIFLKLGAGASSTSFTVRMTDNSLYELPYPIYTGQITAIAVSGTRAIRITELT